ncbi:methyltransferase family protein [Kribbella monticola]|uniref:methyltransferase family protein n=1 Tax=Kribbella monticola TaxID=2185285 RepID=UPI000DD36ED1|nr:isoprenylcysteine carboxylmethyltransferase family protein [Kribbella monticola]
MDPLPFADSRAELLFGIAVGLFAILQAGSSVVALVRRRRARASHVGLDRGTLPLVLLFAATGFIASTLSAIRVRSATIAPDHSAIRWFVFGLGIATILAGATVRLWAIVTLGRWFTYDVRVTEGQPVVQSGPYRWVRHPSYSGVVLVLLGIGLTFGNWLSLLFIGTLPTIGLILRIRVEEAALFDNLGAAYTQYAAGKRRLVPGIW